MKKEEYNTEECPKKCGNNKFVYQEVCSVCYEKENIERRLKERGVKISVCKECGHEKEVPS